VIGVVGFAARHATVFLQLAVAMAVSLETMVYIYDK
jgi:hypothetical protein